MLTKTYYSRILYIIYAIIPFLLITGPALPDIFLTSFSIICLLFYFKKIIKLDMQSWIVSSLLLWIWFIIISFFAINKYLSFTDALIFIRFILFIIFSYILLINVEFKIIKFFLYIILFLCLFIALDSIFQFYNYSNEYGFGGDIFGIKPEGLYGRLSGPFKDLVPGSYLSRFLFFILFLYLLEKKNIYTLFLFTFSISLIISTIYFSGERMALATTLLGIALCIIFTKSLIKILLFSSFLSLIFIILNLNFHPYYNNYKIIESTSKHEGLIIEREFNCNKDVKCKKQFKTQPKIFSVIKNFNESAYGQIYLTSFQMWKDYPISGIGLNNFNSLCEKSNEYKKYHKDFGCTTHPHNYYLQSLVETGIIGFLIFCFLVISLFRKIFKLKFLDYKIVLISALLTIFWPIMSTGSFLKNWNMTFICFVCSIALILSEFIKNSKKNLD